LLQAAAEADAPPLSELTPEEARAARDPVITAHLGPPEEVARVRDYDVPAEGGRIRIRAYTPQGKTPLPGLVYFHGGGWVVGGIETHDSLCRALANGAGCLVFSVGYRLAPENRFPAAAEDSHRALSWVVENSGKLGLDPDRLAVGGDSAGGGLAAAVALMARDRSGPALRFQLLIYPVTDLSGFDKPSYAEYWDKLILTGEGMEFFRDCYLREPEDGLNPYASPLLAPDLKGLPPALVMTAEHDVLTSDGELYAQRLKEAGGRVEYFCAPGVIHLFFGMSALSREENGLNRAVAALREALSPERGS
jgi:acetyl esterase